MCQPLFQTLGYLTETMVMDIRRAVEMQQSRLIRVIGGRRDAGLGMWEKETNGG